jgi:hypothetical protein
VRLEVLPFQEQCKQRELVADKVLLFEGRVDHIYPLAEEVNKLLIPHILRMAIFQAVLEADGGDCKHVTYLEGFIGLGNNLVEVTSILGVDLRLKGLVYALEQEDHLLVDQAHHSVADFRQGLDLLEGEAVQVVHQVAADDYLPIIGVDGELDVLVLGEVVVAFLEQPAENIDLPPALHLQHPVLAHYLYF